MFNQLKNMRERPLSYGGGRPMHLEKGNESIKVSANDMGFAAGKFPDVNPHPFWVEPKCHPIGQTCKHEVHYFIGNNKAIDVKFKETICSMYKFAKIPIPPHFGGKAIPQINEKCSGAMPCTHTVHHEGETLTMSGRQIYELLLGSGVPIPDHFQSYIVPVTVATPVTDVTEDEFVVDVECSGNYPCQHLVVFQGESKMMSTMEICQLYWKRGKKVPKHFKDMLYSRHQGTSMFI